MPPIHDTPFRAGRLADLIEDLSAGLDPDFDMALGDLEREFAELRLTFAE